jgi:hypothetical protein
MKKLIFIAISIFVFAFIWTACQKDCKSCHSVKTLDSTSTVVNTGTSSDYCDTELDAKESEEPSTVGGYTTKWVCE